ncbi:Glutamyl-tRNA(Gln) amidotransferase subunit A [Echinococcus granulosus]|uniref:Glutamyl-tRNA(Gln) amidotransferase subunit A, mitochondrial n=1 Tax=Echinococcus granulosus TaxID=6210 RepID=U6J9X0_ECHGR|nr:Glutamyl-tRNA(Gln) amidotransferase subunit A [Echinococcus granulosus]EUB63358.1 Glutamyl-tRNA(Gln) amidotransferase subunit A [Echinococcus granulosus]CDS20128.1 glutamyl tRNAGln amidotransferase subunit A [Echinococcus granulosus]
MKVGTLERLRSALVRGKLDAGYLCRFLLNRIEIDKSASLEGRLASGLALPTTNSVISHSTELAPLSSFGLLGGIPFLAKDNFCIKSRNATTCASKALHNYSPPFNASVVQALLDAGAICLGKTNMDEFAMGSGSTDNTLHGPVVNPWSPSLPADPCIAGGSSGGSAAAVAAGLAPFALASDTGGSVRNPAALCGVVGLKPTYGLASRQGMIPLANIIDCPSIMATRVADVERVLSTWVQPGSAARRGDATLATIQPPLLPDSPRIGIPKEYYAPGMAPEVVDVWDQVASWLADDFKLSVESVSLPHTPIATAVYSVLCSVEVASNMARYDGLRYGLRAEPTLEIREALTELNLDTSDGLAAGSRRLGFGEEVRNRILAGNFFLLRGQRHLHLDAARRLWRLIKNDYMEVFTKVDFLLAPVTLRPAPNLHEFCQMDSRSRIAREDPCTVGVNLAGLPAISIPIKLSAEKRLPIGLQLIGPPWSEKDLLSLAGRIEEKADFPLLVDIPSLLDIK